MAAEIAGAGVVSSPEPERFNEAAANGRGNRRRDVDDPRFAHGFNEAAANGRGNHRRARTAAAPVRPASMRPRRMAAEIACTWIVGTATYAASMRPRRMAAEIVLSASRDKAGELLLQ